MRYWMSCHKHKVQHLFEDTVCVFSLYMALACVCSTECLATNTKYSIYLKTQCACFLCICRLSVYAGLNVLPQTQSTASIRKHSVRVFSVYVAWVCMQYWMSDQLHKVQRLFEDTVCMFSLYMALECVCSTECLATNTKYSVYSKT